MGPWPVDSDYTANFCLDLSGHGNHLAALNTASNWAPPGTPWIGDPDSPLLPTFTGLAAQSNVNYYEWIVWGFLLAFLSPSINLREDWIKNGDPGTGVGHMFWVAYSPSAALNEVAPNTIETVGCSLPLGGDRKHEFGISTTGHEWYFDPFRGTFCYSNVDSWNYFGGAFAWSGVFQPYTWHHIANTVVVTDQSTFPNTLFQRSFYVDGVLVAVLAGDAVDVALVGEGIFGNQLYLLGGYSDDIRYGMGAGYMADFSIWRKELVPPFFVKKPWISQLMP